ncbi:hypothetical protein F5X68DRAFT_273288 [Plectosphaerella plurivora]|uniref:FAD-binding PCMH-type domain-containing protein n=1 Tax=Plectosphaerella plurivora TaxID=936078 RepID=A0A9P8VJ62_9PEZI|nr:hypothetical protein F5X68DRAFT_273288 [Plectosphaerella plurivora]
MSSLKDLNRLACRYTIPSSSTPITETLSRWGAASLKHPAIIVHPTTEHDVVAAVEVARQNQLKVLPAGGTHGSFVSVTSQNLYLDMSELDDIAINKTRQTVTIGGGVTVGKLLKALTAAGFYAPIPDSNAVGVVGAVLGGGTSHFLGLNGLTVDNVENLRVVTAGNDTAEARTVSASSHAEERALFHALCGAGYGLGAVVSATLRIYPVEELHLTENKVWTRQLIFPPRALEPAAEAFIKLQAYGPLPAQNTNLLFVRSPPGTPNAGSPVIILSTSYFGPSSEAEAAAADLLDQELSAQAIHTKTSLVPLETMNDALEPLNSHAGHKLMMASKLRGHTMEGINASFDKWLATTDRYPDAQGTNILFSAQNSLKSQRLGKETPGADHLVEESIRERGCMVMSMVWCFSPETASALSGFSKEIVEINLKVQQGVKASQPPSFMSSGTKLEDLFLKERAEKVRAGKKMWDGNGVFWSPFEMSD